MRLTTKGRFAVTAMLDIALRQNGGPVSLASVSERQRISLSYLEQLFGRLRKHQLVASTRGPGGGYGLGRRPQDITIADIILAVDEPLDATGCGGKENCHGDDNGGPCMTHHLWSNLNRKMVEYLDSVHLKKLVDDYLLENKDFVASVHTLKPMSYRPLQVDAPNSVFALGQPTQRKTL